VDGVKTTAVPNGVSITELDDNKTDFGSSIVFVGTLNWDPNRKAVLYLAHKIWPLLKQRIPEITCDIIGTHPPQELLSLAESDDAFKVHGFVDDLSVYLKPGVIFACPIKDGGGTKLKVLDALAIKAAVVADPIACEGIEVTDKHDVMLASTPEEYVDCIQEIIKDNELRRKIGNNARKLIVDNYSYEIIGKLLSRLCENVQAER
jgi:glycosyltransferase involved in cell wall biosynthesis